MSFVNQARSKRLVALHGWSGTILGLLLYVVALTGAVAVLAEEIGSWSAGGTANARPITPEIAEGVLALSDDIPAEYRDELVVYPNSGGDIVAFYHGHTVLPSGVPDDIGIMYELDGDSGEVLNRRKGLGSELYGSDRAGALDEFITNLHINLHLPDPWGLYATGILGFILMIAAVSGLLLHKHLLRDIFVGPRYSSALLNRRDRHILAGSWSLPFAFVLAFTGAFFSFATSLGLPVVASVAYGGDQLAMYESLIGEAPIEEDASKADLSPIAGILASAEHRAGSPPSSMTISHLGRADASVSLYHEPPEGSLRGGNYIFRGRDGAFLGLQPDLGTEPSAGDAAFNLMSVLHFGSFAGLMSKVIWVSLGLAMCYVTLTGMQLWVQRRREERLWRNFWKTIAITGYGLPISIGTAGLAFFASFGSSGDTHLWTAVGFVVGAFAAVLVGLITTARFTEARMLRCFLGIVLLALPITRLAMGGPGWLDAIQDGASIIVGLDFLCLLLASYFTIGRLPFLRRAIAPHEALPEPAE